MLQIRYHQDFKGSPALLFAGSSDDVGFLHSFFIKWNGQSIDLLKKLDGKIAVSSITVFQVDQNGNHNSIDWANGIVSWVVSTAHQDQIINLLDGLLASTTSGHQYLEAGSGEIQIMVSKDEDY